MKEIIIKIEETGKEYNLLIGRNRDENDELLKNANPNDIWFHLENISGPHFILQSNGDEIPKKYLNDIAILFKLYKNGLNKKYNVIYTQRKNVKMSKTKGEVFTQNTKILKVNSW